MALGNYSTENLVVVINGRQIQDWGETDPPFTHSYPNELGVMRKGLGRRAVRLDLQEPGQAFTLNLNPGSPDSQFVSTLAKSKANITISFAVLGTLEAGTGREGMITNRQEQGRGGQTITDDIFDIMCNRYSESLGGE